MANDPYQVGNLNPARFIDHVLVCVCCGLKFARRAPAKESRHPARCEPCRVHEPHGTVEQRNEALSEHIVRVERWADGARAKAEEMFRDVALHQAYVKDVKREIAEVLDRRDRYREVLRAVSEVHTERPDGSCSCGSRYPCATIKAMVSADSSIAREVTTYR